MAASPRVEDHVHASIRFLKRWFALVLRSNRRVGWFPAKCPLSPFGNASKFLPYINLRILLCPFFPGAYDGIEAAEGLGPTYLPPFGDGGLLARFRRRRESSVTTHFTGS